MSPRVVRAGSRPTSFPRAIVGGAFVDRTKRRPGLRNRRRTIAYLGGGQCRPAFARNNNNNNTDNGGGGSKTLGNIVIAVEFLHAETTAEARTVQVFHIIIIIIILNRISWHGL